jgi:hypothetical protein
MKYTESEVLDIIKSATDKDPNEIFNVWINKKSNTKLTKSYTNFVYTFPIVVEGKEVGDITLVYLYNDGSMREDLMLKYFGKDAYDISWWSFSHDTYLDCYLTINKEFNLPELCKGMHGDTFQGIDANGDPFEFKVSYGYPSKENDSHLYNQWVNKAYRFDNGVAVIVKQMNGWSLSDKINENIERRLIPYKRAEKLDDILK